MIVVRAPSWLRLQWLWLRLSYRFRWAHRPLCERFSEDVIAIGETHLCRSCVSFHSGALLAAALWISGVLAVDGWTTAGPVLAVVVISGSALPSYKKLPRHARDLLRLGAGMLAAATLLLAAHGHLLGFAALALCASAYAVIRRQRRARRTVACDGCPELGRGQVCSGFMRQAEAGRRLDALVLPMISLAFRPASPERTDP